MGRVASQLKCKNNNNEKKTLPCLSPAPFTSNILLLLNQKKKKQSFEQGAFQARHHARRINSNVYARLLEVEFNGHRNQLAKPAVHVLTSQRPPD